MKSGKIEIYSAVLRSLFRWCVFLIAVTVVVSCSISRQWQSEIEWEEYEFGDLPGREEFPDAAAVVLLDEGDMTVSQDGDIKISHYNHHRIMKILDSRGYQYANIAIPYGNNSTVKDIRARTILPGGEIEVLDQENVYDVTLYPNTVFYSDQRAKIFTMPALQKGAVIEYRYRLEIGQSTLWNSWQFQEDIPVLLSRFTLANPASWDIRYRTYNIDIEPAVKNAPRGFKEEYVWEARNLPALETEFGMPPRNAVRASLAFAPAGIESWEDVGDWYYDLAEPRMGSEGHIRDLAEGITSEVDTDEEKLRRLYNWVRDRVRYIAVEIGIGGYQPHPAKEVLKKRYGDCKDMVTLLASMARAVGIEAYTVLVSTHQNGVPDTTLPSPYQFNHAITFSPDVGENGIWMDATAKGCPYDRLPWYDQGLPVLQVRGNGESQLLRTPETPIDSNKTVIEWTARLDTSGGAMITGHEKVYGSPAVDVRENLLSASPAERAEWLEYNLAELCSGIRIDSVRFTGIESVRDPVNVWYRFYSPHFALPQGSDYTFQPGQFSTLDITNRFRDGKRTHPVQLRYGYEKLFNLTVELPSGWRLASPVVADTVTSDFGYGVWQWNKTRGTLQVINQYRVNAREISPERYPEFRSFLEELRKHDLRHAALTRERSAFSGR